MEYRYDLFRFQIRGTRSQNLCFEMNEVYIYIEGSTSSSREELKLHKDMHGLSDPPVC